MNTSIIRASASLTIALIASIGYAQGPKPASNSSAAEPGAAPHRGYFVANYTIHDRETFRKYMEAAGPLAPKFNGKVIIYDVTAKALEGSPKSALHTIVDERTAQP